MNDLAPPPPKKALSGNAHDGPVHNDSEAARRRGTPSEEMKALIISRAREARAAVNLGHATRRNTPLARAQTESALMWAQPAAGGGLHPSNRFSSGRDVFDRVASDASAVMRAGWRENELGPLWESRRELDTARSVSQSTAFGTTASVADGAGDREDGFDMDEVFGSEAEGSALGASGVAAWGASPNKRSRDAEESVELQLTDEEDDDRVAARTSFPVGQPLGRVFGGGRRGLKATQSLPASGLFGAMARGPEGQSSQTFSMNEEF